VTVIGTVFVILGLGMALVVTAQEAKQGQSCSIDKAEKRRDIRNWIVMSILLGAGLIMLIQPGLLASAGILAAAFVATSLFVSVGTGVLLKLKIVKP